MESVHTLPSIAQLEERETVMGYQFISRSLVRSRFEGLDTFFEVPQRVQSALSTIYLVDEHPLSYGF